MDWYNILDSTPEQTYARMIWEERNVQDIETVYGPDIAWDYREVQKRLGWKVILVPIEQAPKV